MKTTVELPPELMRRIKSRAAVEGTTLKSVLEAALWNHLKDDPVTVRLEMPDGRFRGDGYQAGIDPTDAVQMRSLMYEGNRG